MKSKTQPTQLHEIRLKPMGYTLLVSSNSSAIIDTAQTAFGRFGEPAVDAPVDFTFRMFAHDQSTSKSPGTPRFRRDGNLLHQSAGYDNTLAADLSAGAAFGYLSQAIVQNGPFLRRHFLELALFQMLETRGWMGTHAAAVVKNGQTALLRAPAGGGKSTLAFGAVRRDWQLLAEDVIWISPGGDMWWGTPWWLHLLPDARHLFPELAAYEPVLQTSGEMKLEIDVEQIRPGSTVFSARPGPLVFVDRMPGTDGQLEQIDETTARKLWPAAQTGLEAKLSHHSAHINRLLQRPVFRLTAGDDIQANLNLLESLF